MDAAFKTAAFPGYTTAELKLAIEKGCPDAADPAATIVKMKAEIERRRAVAAGDTSRMTDGERLRAPQERK